MKTELRGRRLGGRYLLTSPLASTSGMAALWEGRDEVLGRRVAIKVLHESLSREPGLLERFRLEAVAAARLSHPSIVRVFDTGVDAGICYIVMELLEGPTLARIVEEEGPLEPPRAASIVLDVLDGLAHAHSAGMVHRDVKPGNVLVDVAGHVKVTDFGIAKAAFAGADLTETGKLLGTARYLAPEQVTGREVDARADLYATGVMLYELLTGRLPFEGETDLATATMRLSGDPPPPSALRAGIPRDLDAIVMKALAREPGDRFSTAGEMRAALDRASPAGKVGPSAAGPHEARPERAGASFFRSWMLVPAALAVLAAGAVVAGALWTRLRAADTRGPQGAAAVETLRVSDVEDHDPGGDGGENADEAPLSVDGDLATQWRTERYNSANLGGLKSGVGLVLDLGRTREVSNLTIRTSLPGWRFQIQGSDDGSSFLPPLRSRDGERRFTAGEGPTSVPLEPSEFRYLLVWITELARTGEGYRATISEVEVGGRR